MRIIAGSSKGKVLLSPPETTRPTSDRAREGMFSSLDSTFGGMAGLAFLDLFAGSGAVGVEALSRGATLVVAVEHHDATAKIATKNFELVSNPEGKFSVICAPAARYLSVPHDQGFDIIFMDPPYEVSNDEIESMLLSIQINGLLADNGLIAIERRTKESPFSWPAPFALEKVRSYGQGSIFYGGRSASV